MVAKSENDLMANRSHRRLPTLVYVRAHLHEADRMIRDSGARISIMARAASYAAHHIGRIYDRNRSPLQLLTLAPGRGPYMTQKKLADDASSERGDERWRLPTRTTGLKSTQRMVRKIFHGLKLESWRPTSHRREFPTPCSSQPII